MVVSLPLLLQIVVVTSVLLMTTTVLLHLLLLLLLLMMMMMIVRLGERRLSQTRISFPVMALLLRRRRRRSTILPRRALILPLLSIRRTAVILPRKRIVCTEARGLGLLLILMVLIGCPSVALWSWFHGTPRPDPGLIHFVPTASSLGQITLVRADVHASISSLIAVTTTTSSHS